MLHGAYAEDSCLADLSARLVHVDIVATGAQNDDAVVAEVGKVVHDVVQRLLFAVTEEAVFLLSGELVDNLGEEVHGIWLVHAVDVHVGDNVDHAAHRFWRRQKMEKPFVLGEFAQNSARIQCLVIVVRVLLGDAVDQGIDNHRALILEHLLHADLVSAELRLGRFLLDVEVAVVRGIPLVLLLWLNLLLDKFDEQGGEGVVVDVV